MSSEVLPLDLFNLYGVPTVIRNQLAETYDPYDPWGSFVSAAHDTADALYMATGDHAPGYRPAALTVPGELRREDEYEEACNWVWLMFAGLFTPDELLYASNVFADVADALKSVGFSY